MKQRTIHHPNGTKTEVRPVSLWARFLMAIGWLPVLCLMSSAANVELDRQKRIGDSDSVTTIISTGPGRTSYMPVKLVRADGSDFYDAGAAASGLTDTELRASPVPVSGSLAIGGVMTVVISSANGAIATTSTDTVITSSVLPTGAATAARQDTGNTSVGSIDTKTPALGQALAAASVPVVLTAAQVTTLTPPAAITNYALETGGNLAALIAKDFATQTTLSALNTKIPSAAALSDATGNPTTPIIGSALMGFNGASWERVHTHGDASDDVATSAQSHIAVLAHGMVFDGTTWDRSRGTSADGTLVNLGANNDVTAHGSSVTIQSPNGNTTPIPIIPSISSIAVYNVPGSSINVTGSTLTIHAAGKALSATGTSLDVNCTGGCGSAAQAATYVMVSTSVLANNATHFCLINKSPTKTIKLLSVDVANASTFTVTGLITRFQFVPVTAGTKGGVSQVSTFSMVTSELQSLEYLIEGSTGTMALTLEGKGGIADDRSGSSPFDRSCFIQNDETPTVGNIQVCNLYDYQSRGGKPYTATAGSTRGWCVIQKGATSTAGRVTVRMEFTQE